MKRLLQLPPSGGDGGTLMNRRQFSVGALSSAPLCLCCAAARSRVNGCRAIGGADVALSKPLPRRTAPRIEDSGSILDTTMWFEDHRTRAQNDFGVTAALCFYDDSDGMNAMAMPDALYPDGPDGTVLMGDNLTRLEWRREPIVPLGSIKFTIGGAWQSLSRTNSRTSFSTRKAFHRMARGRWNPMLTLWLDGCSASKWSA